MLRRMSLPVAPTRKRRSSLRRVRDEQRVVGGAEAVDVGLGVDGRRAVLAQRDAERVGNVVHAGAEEAHADGRARGDGHRHGAVVERHHAAKALGVHVGGLGIRERVQAGRIPVAGRHVVGVRDVGPAHAERARADAAGQKLSAVFHQLLGGGSGRGERKQDSRRGGETRGAQKSEHRGSGSCENREPVPLSQPDEGADRGQASVSEGRDAVGG